MTDADIDFCDHALAKMNERKIAESEVRDTVRQPEEIVPDPPGREIRQSLGSDGRLLRVVVERRGEGVMVVTAYRTSKLAKYGKEST